MPGFQLLMHPVDTVYQYDGSLAGFYCCVHASVYEHELPIDIRSEAEGQQTLLFPRRVPFDRDKALRVREAIQRKISSRALELCEHVFLTHMEGKEIALLRFLLLGFREGWQVTGRLADPLVAPLLKAEKHLLGEAHLLSGFIRFADLDRKLVAAISPKNFVLPLLAPHFADRYSQETFLIHDRTHKVSLLYMSGHAELMDTENDLTLTHSDTERYYQALWKRFYDTIAVEGRENPRCRRTHMPKRYWENMVEMRGAE